MARIRNYTLIGRLYADATSSDTTLHSPYFTTWPVVTGGDTMLLTLDPDQPSKEIVYITAHGSGASTVTVTRGQESTTGVAHPAFSSFRHQQENSDFSDVEAQASVVTDLTDSTGGSAGATLAAITAGASYAQADLTAVKNGIASLNAKLKAVTDALKAAGIMASS